MKKVYYILSLLIIFLSTSLSYSNYNYSVAPLVNEVNDSVVAIKNIINNNENFISGSGFIISEEGHVVTNYHVVKNALQIQVILKSDVYNAKLIGFDKKLDIALLKIRSEKIFDFVEFADSSKIQVGDFILSIGNPFGLGNTVTTGIVSGLNRDINMTPFDNFIQLDSAINKGNSGGPTFNMDGKVIGVNTAILSPTGGNVGLAFSIPSNEVKSIVNDIKQYGFVKRSWIGIHLQPLNDEMLQALNIKDYNNAVIINNVTLDSPADKYNLKVGDIIYGVNDINISGVKDLIKTIYKTNVNSLLKINLIRNKEKINIDIKTSLLPQLDNSPLL